MTPLSADYRVLGEVRVEPEEEPLEVLLVPTFGVHTTSTWGPGRIVREGRPLVAAVRPFDTGAPWQPLGAATQGPWGEATLWLRVFEPPAEPEGPARSLVPARAGDDRPLAEAGPRNAVGEGGALRAGRFELRLDPSRSRRR